MASQRRLSELLEEQQEPFFLHIHLLESGCSIKRLQRLGSRRRIGVGFLRSILAKLVVHGNKALRRKALGWDSKSIESGRLSVFDCFSETGTKTHDGEADQQWRCREEMVSPVSVFELHSDQSSPYHNHIGSKEEYPSTSSDDSPREASQASGFHQCRRFKKEVSREEKLLLDCAREAEEKFWDSHVTEEAVHEKVQSWERLRGDVSSLTRLMSSDMSDSGSEWSQFRREVGEIGLEIEAAIFEEIRGGIVMELLGFDCTNTTLC